MKMVWILHDIVLTDEIQNILDELGVIGVTRWPRLAGRGPKSGARMDNHVWPGANAACFAVVEADGAPAGAARRGWIQNRRLGLHHIRAGDARLTIFRHWKKIGNAVDYDCVRSRSRGIYTGWQRVFSTGGMKWLMQKLG